MTMELFTQTVIIVLLIAVCIFAVKTFDSPYFGKYLKQVKYAKKLETDNLKLRNDIKSNNFNINNLKKSLSETKLANRKLEMMSYDVVINVSFDAINAYREGIEKGFNLVYFDEIKSDLVQYNLGIILKDDIISVYYQYEKNIVCYEQKPQTADDSIEESNDNPKYTVYIFPFSDFKPNHGDEVEMMWWGHSEFKKEIIEIPSDYINDSPQLHWTVKDCQVDNLKEHLKLIRVLDKTGHPSIPNLEDQSSENVENIEVTDETIVGESEAIEPPTQL